MKIKHNSNDTNNKHEKLIPRGFFQKIGITPFIDPNDKLLHKKFRKKVGPKIADDFYHEVYINENHNAALDIAFSHLGSSKLWYGNALIETSRIATELETLSVPDNAKILDIGGGPGVLAFWMTTIWKDSHVTVADKYSKVGMEWAKEIGNNQVTFIDSLLPDLVVIPEYAYDVVILSRVLSYLKWMTFPKYISAYNIEDYFKTQSGADFKNKFIEVVEKIKRVMLPDGHIIFVEQWHASNILVVCKLFEQCGLYIDPDFFLLDRVSENYSVIAFSQSVKGAADHNFSLGMSALMNFPRTPFPFIGSLAEAIRKTFNEGVIIAEIEVERKENNLKMKHEFIMRDGLALLYTTDTYGNRRSLLFPSVKLSEIMKELENIINMFESDNSTKIINRLLAA